MGARETLESAEPLSPETRCTYCRLRYDKQPFGPLAFQADHLIPRSVRPDLENELTNLVWACIRCNIFKGARFEGQDNLTHLMVRFFHPKRQSWGGHFMGAPTGVIYGMTSTGRVTVDGLRHNGSPQVVRPRAEGFEEGWWP